MNLILRNYRCVNIPFNLNIGILTNYSNICQKITSIRTIANDSTELVQYTPLTSDNWIEKCYFYSKNECLKNVKSDIGVFIRNDLKALLNINFPHKKLALVKLCKHLSDWNCCDTNTCRLVRSEIDKISLNPIENDGVFHVYLHGARGLSERKRNVRLCKMVLSKLYKYEHVDNFDQLIDYLSVIALYYKPDLSTKRRIERMLNSMIKTFHQYDASKLAMACSRLKLEGKFIVPMLYKRMIDPHTLLRDNRLSRALVKWRIATNWSNWSTNYNYVQS